MIRRIAIIVSVMLFFISISCHSAPAGRIPAKAEGGRSETSPVMFHGKELFSVRGFKTISSEDRARGIAGRIKKVADDLTVRSNAIITDDTDISTDVVAADQIILSVTDKDASVVGRTRQDLAADYAEKIRTTIEQYRVEYSRKSILYGSLYAFIATVACVALLFLFKKLLRRLDTLIETRYLERIHSIHIKSIEIIQAQRVRALIQGALTVIRFIFISVLLFAYVHLLLSFFPWTRPFAGRLLGYLLVPLRVIGNGVVKHIPNLLFIAVLTLITRFVLKFMHTFFGQVEKGTVTLSGFYPEWAKTTDKLLSFLIIAFAVVVAFPYIPGSDSPAFKGVSIFIGILFSLGSQSAVSNIIGGLVMTYRRAFNVGDRIKIGDVIGDVTEIKLQLTHMRTIKNEDVIVPNSTILNSNITNYSSYAREKGLILHTSVTIGYDAPWRQVHELLLMAAARTQGLLKEPPPFVLQKSLDDFYVNYELNVYSDAPQQMVRTYSELHKNIQDCFNEYGVQIMSPHYVNDPVSAKIVPKEQWYALPARLPEQGKGD